MVKQEIALCLEIDDMATDENGNPGPAGMKLSFGTRTAETAVSYDELTKDLSLENLTQIIPLLNVYREKLGAGKIRIITPEEYNEKYGNDEEEDEEEYEDDYYDDEE